MRYSDEQIIDAVQNAKSISETLRNLGAGKSGSAHAHLSRRIERLNVSTEHFVKGFTGNSSSQKKAPEDILVVRRDRREHTYQLRRALIESGVPYRCNECDSLPEWNGKPLRLEIEHKNGDAFDNRKKNLEFLCPNCHSQRPIDYKRVVTGTGDRI